MDEHTKTVEIHIDGKRHEVAPATTGAALYALGKIRPEYDLFREVRGPGDDDLIQNSSTPLTVHSGDQFYSAKRTLNPGSEKHA